MIRIWTDGAAREDLGGPGGWAFVAVKVGVGVIHRASGGVECGNAGRMELLAVVEALRWADGRPVEVFTDSHYVARSFKVTLKGWAHNGFRKKTKKKTWRVIPDADLWSALWDLHRRSPAKIEQVRRAIHTYNVEADQAAGEALRSVQGPGTEAEQQIMHALDNALRN